MKTETKAPVNYAPDREYPDDDWDITIHWAYWRRWRHVHEATTRSAIAKAETANG